MVGFDISGSEPLGSNTRYFNPKQNYRNCAHTKSNAFQREDLLLLIFIIVIFIQTNLSVTEMHDMNKKRDSNGIMQTKRFYL
jgi:hypothetical protein